MRTKNRKEQNKRKFYIEYNRKEQDQENKEKNRLEQNRIG